MLASDFWKYDSKSYGTSISNFATGDFWEMELSVSHLYRLCRRCGMLEIRPLKGEWFPKGTRKQDLENEHLLELWGWVPQIYGVKEKINELIEIDGFTYSYP